MTPISGSGCCNGPDSSILQSVNKRHKTGKAGTAAVVVADTEHLMTLPLLGCEPISDLTPLDQPLLKEVFGTAAANVQLEAVFAAHHGPVAAQRRVERLFFQDVESMQLGALFRRKRLLRCAVKWLGIAFVQIMGRQTG